MKLLISIISLAGILSSVGQESAIYLNKEEVVPTGEAAWRALEFNISKHHGWRIDDCVKLFEADTDEFLSKKLIEEIDSEIVDNRPDRLYHDKGLLYIEVASRFASHKPHVEEYLFKIAVSDDELMRKGQKTHSEIPAGRSLSNIILLHVGLNMHPDAYNSLNKLWNALDHHEENKRTYYFSLCSRIENNVNKDQAIHVLESLLKDENDSEIIKTINTLDHFAVAKEILQETRGSYITESDQRTISKKQILIFCLFVLLAFTILISSVIFKRHHQKAI